jgi:hypothetical protein
MELQGAEFLRLSPKLCCGFADLGEVKILLQLDLDKWGLPFGGRSNQKFVII